jgi:hypothetical protein
MPDAISGEALRAVKQPADAEALRARAQHAVTIAIDGRAISVSFDEALWAADFEARFAEMVCVQRGDLVHYVVRSDPGYHFWSPGGPAWVWDQGPLASTAVAFLAECTALATLIRSSPQLVSFHAAAIGRGGIAAAIAGHSSAGKSTTAIACARRAMGLYSDERCVLSNNRVVPFARTLHLRGGGLRLLAAEPVAEHGRNVSALPIPSDAAGAEMRISTLFGVDAIPAPAPLRAVFLISGCEARPRAVRAEWFDLAPSLLQRMDSEDEGLARIGRLRETLRGASCYRLYLGSPDTTAALIGATLAALEPARAC